MTKRKKRTQRKQKHVDAHHAHGNNPETPDIAGENAQLKLDEQNLPPFFRSLLDAGRPLPHHVKFHRYHEPEMGVAIPILAIAFFFCFLPAVALLIDFVTKQMYEVFPIVVMSLFLSAFGFVLYHSVKTYRNVRAFRKDKRDRYGIFLCRYALFVRVYDETKKCQLFPKHTLMDISYWEGKDYETSSYRYVVTLYYNNEKGKKMPYPLLSGLGSFTKIDIFRDWLDSDSDSLVIF